MRKIIKGVHEFQTNYFNTHRELFERLSEGQHPRILFITCSDSRIDPNLLTQTEPGELFIIRNVGNIIPPYGATTGAEGAAIEYAVEALGIKHIIVCGHSHCGAMKGLLQPSKLTDKMPLVYDWLKYAEGTRRIIQENYQDYEGDALLNAAIEENVLTQIENLRSYPVIHSKLYKGQLELHAWVYKIETGGVYVYSAERCSIKADHEEEEIEKNLQGAASHAFMNGNGKVSSLH
ncbi:MAG TPA: carbonate dehydratase [Cyanobacteria bacterium UBA12227]|nr:carbonate dehydratase [Cyanobacteria bacterium UBA12227]HAX85079.1 carbonate dehydratase [Cyanobacteria bacterium UBA11370]HBY81237.1 carbonate dehydratase [Cyanobacteria bacterium UBA11148]